MAAISPALLLTRPFQESETFGRLCSSRLKRQVRQVISPVFEVAPVEMHVELDRFPTLVFSSPNAVRILAERHAVKNRSAICVGDKTAATAAMVGMKSVSANGSADDLVDLLKNMSPPAPLLHVRGLQTRGHIAGRLSASGIETHEAIAYRQSAMKLNDEAVDLVSGDSAVLVPVFSPRSAQILSKQIPEKTAPLHLIAMSKSVAGAWTARRDSLTVAQRPDAAAMMDAVASFFPD